MTLKLADDGVALRLDSIKTQFNAAGLKLKLFKSNTTPTTSSVVGDFTESTFSGYAGQALGTLGAASVAAHVATIAGPAQTFTRSATGAGELVYGYYVTNTGGTIMYWAERDPLGPFTLTNVGDSYTVTPKMTDQDLST